MSEKYRILEPGEIVENGDEILIRHSKEITGKERWEKVVNNQPDGVKVVAGKHPYEYHKFRRKVSNDHGTGCQPE